MSFNLGALIVGLIVLAAGGAMVLFYRPVAENIAHGVSSYDRVKLFGIILIGVGLIIMTNLHTVILTWLIRLVVPNV